MLCLFAGPVHAFSDDHPLIANYYLDELQSSQLFIDKMASYDLLILTPAQIKARASVVHKIRLKNPNILIFAYVPSQSYNSKYWNSDNVFKYLQVKDEWWMRDEKGKPVYIWPTLKGINMDEAWSKYLVDFVNSNILTSQYIDGIFFDMISHNISWVNNGEIDLDNDGKTEGKVKADSMWLDRTTYLLDYAKNNLKTEYIVINGSSHQGLQPYVNGRMFETFPTPWEGNGSWETVMNNLVNNRKKNEQPQITIINTNTDNTGNRTDYAKMRFGLGSALLEGVYSSFDHGDQDHGQTWWYDEYDVDLGEAISDSSSKKNYNTYKPDIWTRDFENGIAVVNSTQKSESVELGGEYEAIRGTQDKTVNDGSIVSELFLNYYDGRILLKTFSTLNDMLFPNGSFVRFFRPDGSRVRNGFFTFDEKYRGGNHVAYIDFDGNGRRDIFIATDTSFRTYRYDGLPLMQRKYPFPNTDLKKIVYHIADVNKDGHTEIYTAPAQGENSDLPIRIYTHTGRKKHRDWYPFGETYTGGYSFAVAENKSIVQNNRLIVAGGVGYNSRVHVYTYRPYTLEYSWAPYEAGYTGGINVAAGDIDGDGYDEVIIGAGKGKKPEITVFDITGKRVSGPFIAYQTFMNNGIDVRAVDVDFDGRDDIIGVSEGI